MTREMGTQGLGNTWDSNRGRQEGEQVSGAGWGSSHIHNSLYRGSGNGRGEAEYVQNQVGSERGRRRRRSRQTDGRGHETWKRCRSWEMTSSHRDG